MPFHSGRIGGTVPLGLDLAMLMASKNKKPPEGGFSIRT